jgi:hypothetical protein
MRSGKIEFETLAQILLLTAFLIIVLLLFKGCMDAYSTLGTVGVKEYGCWATNVMKANVMAIFPSTCREIIVKDKVDTLNLGRLMGTCWWEYGQGQWDLGTRQDITAWMDFVTWAAKSVTESNTVSTCYILIPKEDIRVDDLKVYMETNNIKGEKVTKPKDTMWNYLQDFSKGDNVCFDEKDGGVLKKGEIYYIKFMDDRGVFGLGKRDLLLITSDKQFFDGKITSLEFWTNLFGKENSLCYKYGTAKVSSSTGGTSFKKLEEFTEKINNCAKFDTTTECYCDSMDFSGLPTNYKVFMGESSPKSSMIQVIDSLSPGTMTSVKGAILQATCPGVNSKCTKIIFDNTGKVYIKESNTIVIGVSDSIEKPCCQLQGTWQIMLKKENNIKTVILTQRITPREKCKA